MDLFKISLISITLSNVARARIPATPARFV